MSDNAGTGVKPFVLFDTDGVIVDYEGKLRPGIRMLMLGFIGMGYEIKMWSGNGCKHASDVADQFSLPCNWFITKPAFPMTRESVMRTLGRAPALQFDDDLTEYVGHWPFMEIECEGHMPGRKPKEGHYQRRRTEALSDPVFRAEYDRARAEIAAEIVEP